MLGAVQIASRDRFFNRKVRDAFFGAGITEEALQFFGECPGWRSVGSRRLHTRSKDDQRRPRKAILIYTALTPKPEIFRV